MVRVKLTNHSIMQAKQRLGLSEKALDRMVQKAYTNGLNYNETTGKLRKYLEKKAKLQARRHKNLMLVVYGECLYILVANSATDLYLLTSYQLNNDMKKEAVKQLKLKQR